MVRLDVINFLSGFVDTSLKTGFTPGMFGEVTYPHRLPARTVVQGLDRRVAHDVTVTLTPCAPGS